MKKILLLFSLVMFLSGVSFAQATLEHSYDFTDGTANDVVGEAHGSIIGGEIVNGTYTTSADGEYIELPAGAIAINTHSSVTIEAYLLSSSVTPGNSMLWYFGGSEGSPGLGANGVFLAIQPATRTVISCGNLTEPWTVENEVRYEDGPANTLNETYHFVVTLSETEIRMYINGEFIGTTPFDEHNSIANLSNDFAWIARGGYENDPTWLGTLFEFNVYSGIMDEATIYTRSLDFPIETSDPTIATLETNVGEISPAFDPIETDYEIFVPYGTTKIELTTTTTEKGSEVEIFDGMGNPIEGNVITFNENGIDLEILVTALDGSEYAYYVSIFHDEPEKVSTLSGIELSSGYIKEDFYQFDTVYTAFVPTGVTSVDVTAIPTWEGATVTGGGSVDLSSGEANVSLTCTSEDENATTTYTLNIFSTLAVPDVEFLIVHETSRLVLTGLSDSTLMIKNLNADDPEQTFTLVESGIEGQYFIKSAMDQHIVPIPTSTWDLKMSSELTADLDSSRFSFEEYEPGKFRIHSMAKPTYNSDLLGSNSDAVGGVFNDKVLDDNDSYTYWMLVSPEEKDYTLDSIYIEGVKVPAFAAFKTDYEMVLPVGTTSVNVEAFSNNASATIEGTGSVDVESSGTITVSITVSGETRDYNINYKVDSELTLNHSWTFADGTAKDVVGNAHGEVAGGEITEGKFISTANGHHITLPSEEIAINEYTSITLEAYVVNGQNDSYTMLMYFGTNNGGENCYWVQPTRGDDASRTEVGTGTAVTAAGLEATPDVAQHFVSVLTYDSIKWYIDGYKVSSMPLPGDVQISKISNQNAWIGKGAWPDPSWMGEILEVNIYAGAMDDNTVAMRSLNFPQETNESLATLSAITFGEDTIKGFASYVFEYDSVLAMGSTTTPELTAIPKAEGATVVVVAADEIPGATTITVTSANGENQNTYIVNFDVDVELSDDASLTDLQYNETSVDGFSAETFSYDVELPAGTTDVPEVTATTSNENASVNTDAATGLPGATTITVTAEDGETVATYTINFSIETSVNTINNQLVNVFPTVSDGAFTVRANTNNYKVSVYSITGKKVMETKASTTETRIHVPAKGMYLFAVEMNNEVKVFKVVSTK
ncbi:MAG: T9SS type A sorting domain-containing protein [Prolixibacteraceae bacterium]|nr:T9SS type A sorting domain-containing protein [Prolixibacteraceae bacterium]